MYRNHTLISHNFLIRTHQLLLTCFQLPRSIVQNLLPSKLLRSALQQGGTHLYFTLSFPQTDAGKFPCISTAHRDQLMADLLAVATSREQAITGAIHNDGARAWEWWWKYCKSVGCDDPYLDSFSQIKQNLMLRAFAMAVREGRFTQDCTEPLVEGSVQGTISHVLQAFWESG
jgi:hypothetical protein